MAFPSPPQLREASRGYSLIELLAVVAILSALAGLTMGSLSPVKANALTAGGNKVADLLASARQNSISRHSFTAVVIKSVGDSRYSAHCLFELARTDSGAFAAWKMIAPWRSLPDGVRFDPGVFTGSATNFVYSNPSGSPPSPSPLPSTVQFRGQTVNITNDVVYQIFGPDGTLTRGAPVRLRLVEAGEDTGSGIIYTGQKTAGQPANYYDIVILRETGQAKVERL
jgi:prepilin-type N-terminal cleavage/methylation domain-containing protein